ncbi:RsmD family RNA methyltransferase [Treponema pedis]|uniref:RsmD family RNA methyltransferase n=1 Tax=Treponema pedis TaxID=409322 RepID=A0A7S6WNE2_9SPIR|nr:RsmD family RNA methyltransferase [Treponema pedis]QOW59777.1 RsmD family RNA methyltransferase [Treponema pedis]
MRITGGILKNRVVVCPKGIIRPAMDRMRESLFSILGDLTGFSFLDLFTGSGICGLEAYSRGAYPVYLVEKDGGKFPVLLKNASMADKKLECKKMPVELFIKRSKISFDIIYIDPPFPYKFHLELLEQIAESEVLKKGGSVLIHRPAEKELPEIITAFKDKKEADGISPEEKTENCQYRLVKKDKRIYGRSIVDFYIKE